MLIKLILRILDKSTEKLTDRPNDHCILYSFPDEETTSYCRKYLAQNSRHNTSAFMKIYENMDPTSKLNLSEAPESSCPLLKYRYRNGCSL